MADAGKYTVTQTSKPILLELISADRGAINAEFSSDGSYDNGVDAQKDLLKMLAEQRDAYEKHSTDSYLVKPSVINSYNSSLEKLADIDLSENGQNNMSEESKYLLNIAAAFKEFSQGAPVLQDGKIVTPEPRIMFDPVELETRISGVNGHGTYTSTGLRDKVDGGGLSSGRPHQRDAPNPNGNEKAWLNTPVEALNIGRAAIHAEYNAPLPTKEEEAEALNNLIQKYYKDNPDKDPANRPQGSNKNLPTSGDASPAPTATESLDNRVDNRDAVTKAADNITKILQAGGGLAGMLAKAKAAKAEQDGPEETDLGNLPEPPSLSKEHNARESGTSIERK